MYAAAAAAAAAAHVVRVSSKPTVTLTGTGSCTLLHPLNFTFASRARPPGARCAGSLSRFRAKDEPLYHKSPVRNTTAWQIRHSPRYQLKGAARFVLVPHVAARTGPHPAITRLRRSTGMLCYVQVVGTPTADTPGGCLMLHFDNRRYLFGRMAEGTQRNMTQRGVSLAKIHDIFLTGCIGWDAAGGLLGMILTLADLRAASTADTDLLNEKLRSRGSKNKKSVAAHINIHGGENLLHLLATARRFILRKALPVNTRELRRDPRAGPEKKDEADYEDENIRVWSIPLTSEKPAERPSSSSGESSPKKRKLSASSDPLQNPAAEEETDQSIREAVIEDMFCSRLKLDTLREFRLADVHLPASIFVRNDQGHIVPYTGPPASEAPDAKVLVRLPWPAAQIDQLPATKPSKQSMCYIVKCHPRRGKFNVDEAIRLGVAKTDYRKLIAGKTVSGKDSVVVTPAMILGDQIEGRGFAVVDLPHENLIEDLLARHEWSNPDIMKGIDTMYWILSDGITLESQGVRQFIKAHSSIKHVVLGSAVCPNLLALESPASQLIRMNYIDKERFPLPVFDNRPTAKLAEEVQSVAEPARAGLKYQLAPKPTFLTDEVVPVMDTKRPLWDLATFTPAVKKLADVARKAASEPAFLADVEKSQRDLPSPQTEIIPLGTGSAMPSKYRNVSATLVRVPGWGSYLLDCGENTLGQLRRTFGYQGADEVLKDLRAIYISHAHADHHLGTINVIARWRKAAPETSKLAIIATPKYHDFVREFYQVQHLTPGRLVHVTLRCPGRPMPGRHAETAFPAAAAAHLPKIQACYVDHCFESIAVVLTFPDTGLKIAYSGDCRPSREFADLARGAHLLLHECTFEDELRGDAMAKKHSTLSEALDVGRQMEARRILLTHFSQRYPQLPVVDENALKPGGQGGKGGEGRDVEVLFAFDMMRVKLGEFKQANMFLPALRELLKEVAVREEEEEERGEGEGV